MDTSYGDYSLRIVDSTVIIDISGSLDESFANQAVPKIKASINDANLCEWACLVDLSHWDLHTPEFVPAIKEFQNWSVEHSQVVEVCITGDSIMTKQIRDGLLEGGSALNVIYVRTREDGIEWLTKNGYISKGEDIG